jgi:bifunctional UDP-N-acetylglucosamine pyrophosphorylase/glucosamine-1-phosphate N-acetyltransferase
MATTVLEDPTGYGRVVRDASGAVERVVETKRPGDASEAERRIREVNTGIFAFSEQALRGTLPRLRGDNAQGELYLPEVLVLLREAGERIEAHAVEDRRLVLGVNDRAALAQVRKLAQAAIHERHMLAGVTVLDPDATVIDVDVEIGEDTVIEPFSHIKGHSVIGSECRIGPHVHIEDARVGDRSDCGPFAKLRPGTVVAEDVHIGSFAELVRTKVGRGSRVPHVSYLGDTTLGEDANIGAGTITANYNGESKNRTEIGDGAFVGVDTMLVAPVKLGKGARTGAGSVVTKDVPDGATAVGVPARVIRRKAVGSDHK